MLTCLACGAWGRDSVCGPCRASLIAAPDRRLQGGLLVRSLFVHESAAATLVRRFKYEGVRAVADVLARPLVGLVPATATAFVPVPRTTWRHIRYGIDPAMELSRALRTMTGLPMVRGLTAPLVAPRHAGRDRVHRGPIEFRMRRDIPAGAILVDDVVTTGSTLMNASAALDPSPSAAMTITAALGVTSLSAGRTSSPDR